MVRDADDDHVRDAALSIGGVGVLFASQVATGEGNALRLRVYGSKAAIYFDQETTGLSFGYTTQRRTVR